MPLWRVTLLGRNFLLAMDGKAGRYGFYTTRWVCAEDAASAEQKAVSLVKEDADLKGSILNDQEDPPVIFLEELSLEDQGREGPGKGYTFFSEEDASAGPALDLGDDSSR